MWMICSSHMIEDLERILELTFILIGSVNADSSNLHQDRSMFISLELDRSVRNSPD